MRGRSTEGEQPPAAHSASAPHPHAHISTETFTEAVDPAYWPKSMWLRIIIAFSYFVLVPAGLLPMSEAWWLVSGGVLLGYSIGIYAIYLRFGLSWLHDQLSAYLDCLVVTLAIIALADPETPIWMGYFLVLPALANFHTMRYVMAFTAWSIANFLFGFAVLDWTGRADVNWAYAAVIAIMAVFCGLNADIIATSNRKLRMLVRESSLTDPLTGLANRRRFRQVLDSHRMPEARPLAVLMYDLDNFKQINEVEGHVHADGVLVQVAQELADSFRDADTVARYGGDEMIVLAHVDSLDDAIAMGERSLARVRERVGVTLSAGLSVYPLISRTLDAAVKEADTALGTAKHGGKARRSVAGPGPAAA